MELNTETVATPARTAATVVVLRNSRAGPEVLLLKRHGLSDVLGGAYVFPGGKVDARDGSPALQRHLDRTPAELHARLQEADVDASTATSLFVAAIRETFEESGILFAEGIGHRQAAAARAMLHDGLDFGDMLARLSLRLHTDAVLPWSRWITPRVPMVTNKRFDTRFFVAPAPDGQQALPDKHEATECLWITPRAALERYWAGNLDLAPPQIMSLSFLSHFPDVPAVLRQARANRPPLVEPEPFLQDGLRVVCYPGDERHSSARRAFPGPTRLTYRNRRFEPSGGFDSLFACAPGFFDVE
jgi:8-oxo-dGTP pyrophosphatase MutT (NUDIX family)